MFRKNLFHPLLKKAVGKKVALLMCIDDHFFRTITERNLFTNFTKKAP